MTLLNCLSRSDGFGRVCRVEACCTSTLDLPPTMRTARLFSAVLTFLLVLRIGSANTITIKTRRRIPTSTNGSQERRQGRSSFPEWGIPSTKQQRRQPLQNDSIDPHLIGLLQKIRGGVQTTATTATGKRKMAAKNKDSSSSVWAFYASMPPFSRFFLTSLSLTALITPLLGDEVVQGLLALSIHRLFEPWRPVTSALYLGGPPSLPMLSQLYFIHQFSAELERAYGTAQMIYFWVSQVVWVSLWNLILGIPFSAPSIATALLYVASRQEPGKEMRWLMFRVPLLYMPVCWMAADVLQAQSIMAAIPHLVGVLTGHAYHFVRFIWPRLKGEQELDWLEAPVWLKQYVDEGYEGEQTKRPRKLNKRKGRKLGSPS